MITSLIRGALRFIAAVALFVVGMLGVIAVNQQYQAVQQHKVQQVERLKAAESSPQTYRVPGIDLPPKPTRDTYLVVIAKPKPTATKQQAAAPRKTSTANNRPPVPVYTIAAAQEYAASRLSATQYLCLANIVTRESGWDIYATNTSSGAYGIPQALPGSKMASAGSDWRTNYKTQINWMIDYVNDRYGSACGAWSYWQAHSNY